MHQLNNSFLRVNKDGIILFYFHIPDIINTETIQSLISAFSAFEQNNFNSFKNKDALKRTLFSRIILKYVAAGLGIAHSEFVSLAFSGKPVFTLPNGFDFNISHSGNMVVCCITKDSSVGIDIELNRPVNIEIYRNCFDRQEWQFITESEFPGLAFLKLWVRKEAVIKADGKGFGIELSSFNCLKNKSNLELHPYFIDNIDFGSEYTCAIACSKRKIVKLTDFNKIFNTEYNIRLSHLQIKSSV